MFRKFAVTAAAAAMASLLGVGTALAQPTLTNPGGGTGNSEMDHSLMGGTQGASRPGPAPVLTNPSGSGDADMDHSRMGGGNQGAGAPQGGSFLGTTGGGPEVRHGDEPSPGNEPNRAQRPRT